MSFEKDAIIIEPKEAHKASVIWLHGLGADGHDFEPIVPELGLPDNLGIPFYLSKCPETACHNQWRNGYACLV